MDQLSFVHDHLSGKGIVTCPQDTTFFIDWNDQLDKAAAAQGVYCYALASGVRLAQALEDSDWVVRLKHWLEEGQSSARQQFWKENDGYFVCGDNGQRSWASQIWMTLGGVLSKAEARLLLRRTMANPPDIRMITPYLRHYWIEALLQIGERELACREMERYWGAMLDWGADTFWEIFDPDNPSASPYGGAMIHSYCHAWSCSPAAWIGKCVF
ncbi:MAG: hypothetical protein PHI98_15295 [Eubacteriales bacterium]|nr:hypothetical protein [Eubacteriales bacterium]